MIPTLGPILAVTAALALTQPAPPPAVDAFGLGPLRLGMTVEQAQSTGRLGPFEATPASASCRTARLTDNRGDNQTYVAVSRRLGVAAVQGPLGTRTPEGIGAGATADQLLRAYPEVHRPDLDQFGRAEVAARGNPKAVYRIELGPDKRVAHVAVQLVNQDCYE